MAQGVLPFQYQSAAGRASGLTEAPIPAMFDPYHKLIHCYKVLPCLI